MTIVRKLRSRALGRALCLALAAGIVLVGPIGRMARAELVSTEAALEAAAGDEARARLAAFLDREQVREELSRLGVDAGDARSRVALLSDAEAAAVAGQLDALPVGGNGIVAVFLIIAVVFLILVFTDALGITDIFPWVKGPK
jgi:hypothetical protein